MKFFVLSCSRCQPKKTKMEQVIKINAAQITDPANPMRSEIDRERVHELAESIKREGLINPITVRPVGDKFEVVAGHRRFLACRIANVVDIPCVVRELDDAQALEITAHENLFREDVDPVDEALFLGRIIGEDESKIPDVAKRLNRSEQWVSERLEILTFPDYLVTALKDGKIKLGVAKWLGRIADETYRQMFVTSAVRDGMPVWQAEYYYTQWNSGIFKPGEDILPPEQSGSSVTAAKARAKCERCGGIAEDPNLRNVFIHVECPSQSDASPKEL